MPLCSQPGCNMDGLFIDGDADLCLRHYGGMDRLVYQALTALKQGGLIR